MTGTEAEAIRAVIGILREPRNRYGKVNHGRQTADKLHDFVETFGKLPHGGYDSLDKAQMILSLMVGDPPQSIMDPPLSRV